MEQILFDYIQQHITLSEEEKNIIKELGMIRSYRKGTVLLEEGKRSNDTYFVLKGCLRCFSIIEGEEKTTEFYTELEGVIPLCVMDGTPSGYYVSCLEDSVLLISNAMIEQAAFARFPRFETLCRILTEQLAVKSQAELSTFKTSSPEQRYLKLLETKPDLVNRVTQFQLASYLGITPVSLSRIRGRIARKGRSQ